MRWFICIFLLISSLLGQEINWSLQSSPSLPEGIELYKGTRLLPKLQAWYLDINMNNPDLAIRPILASPSATVPQICQATGAYVAVNGGFFGGSTSYSSVIYPGEIKAINVPSLTRNNKSYPVLRSLFSMNEHFEFSVDWIYHFDASSEGLYLFDQPLPYSANDPDPLPAPQKEQGFFFSDILTGIGGAPTLLKDSTIHVSYKEEILWGSGVGLDNNDPRTAVGYTRDKHVIFFVADGRQTVSEGLGLTEMAEILLSLGCIEAMNLDGGGSTQMALSGEYINSPSEQRTVPSILAVVHRDSLGIPPSPVVEKIIDSEDPQCSLVGDGWFTSANTGYWGGTAAQLNPAGSGLDFARFRPELMIDAKYKVYAWWVAASNRSTNTPFIINHNDGQDTVRVDQTANGSSWFLLGEYHFSGDTTEKVLISDAAPAETYIVADAIRWVSYDTSSVVKVSNQLSMAGKLTLAQNYPNPFNPKTNIEYSVTAQNSVPQHINLSIYNLLGQKVATLVDKKQPAGAHEVQWDASGFASGVYIYTLETGTGYKQSRKLLLLK